jgi:hypothetical protein
MTPLLLALLQAATLTASDAGKPIPRDQTLDSFQGDAEISNGRLKVVVRKGGKGAEVYAPEGVLRAVLSAGAILRVALVENGRGSIALDTGVVKLRLKRGDVAVEVEAGSGPTELRIECPSRFLVLPDFFADDIVIDATRIPLPATELPSENFLIHPIGKGDALGLTVFENREQDVRIALSGGQITASDITFGKGRKIWFAVLTGPGLWHQADVREQDLKKVVPLGWTMPFPAQWRVDFTRTGNLTDSWEMIHQKEKDGQYFRQEWFDDWQRKMGKDRKRWTTVLGSFPYPCWTEHDGRGFLQPIKHPQLTFGGPAILYPLNRVKETPADVFTVVDVVRSTLGMGPCEYILDLEGQKEKYAGINTCSVRDRFNEIFPAGQQKEKRKEMEKMLDDTLTFVRSIRKRIDEYLEFSKGMKAWLGEQKQKRPEAAAFLDEALALVGEVDAREAVRRDKMKTPDFVAKLNDEFRKSGIGLEGPEGVARAKEYGKALTEVGDNQDELVGEFRWIVKTLRQKAGLAMAMDPKLAPLAEEIRAMTQKMLRNPNALERARH